MAFVTERISKEDIEKYSLLETINKIRKKYDDDEISLWFLKRLDWCIERENNTWLIRISHDYLRDIGDYALTKTIWLLHYKSNDIELDLRRIFNDETIGDPHRIIYELHDIKTDAENTTSDEIIDILKKILSVYGSGGVGLENFTLKEKLKVSFNSQFIAK